MRRPGRGSAAGRPATTFAERVVDRASAALAGTGLDRRRLLGRAALVGTALAVNPIDFVLKPRTAYAAVCGTNSLCSQGYTAFCCTINGGANTCPPGSFVAGWWKVGDSAFCNGGARYYVDCNRAPGASCACRCADGPCDKRRICCNNFRYGQCNQQIRGVTEVVCRVVLCTPPWEWDPTCTTTVRQDLNTRSHTATCLPGPNPSAIAVRYQDLGLTGSPLGVRTGGEFDGPRGGRWARYERGVITFLPALGARVALGGVAQRYRELDTVAGVLGYVVAEARPVGDERGRVAVFEGGRIYATEQTGAHEVVGPVLERYVAEGGATGWLGYPVTGTRDAPGARTRSFFEADWSIAYDPSTRETRLVPSELRLPDEPGVWPATAEVVRWAGDDRVATAVRVSREAFDAGVDVAFVSRADDFADALVGGVVAGRLGGPVLLTYPDRAAAATLEELRRLAPDRLIVLGGPPAVSAEVADELAAAAGVPAERLEGDDRFTTAAAVSGDGFEPGVPVAFIANGLGFPDALSAAPTAAAAGGPILLVGPGTLPEATRAELARLAPRRIVVLGSEAAVGASVFAELRSAVDAEVVRWAGPNRYATSARIAEEGELAAGTVFVVTGQTFPDGLAAGPAAIAAGAALLLVAPTDVPAVVDRQLRRLAPSRIVVVGGEAAVGAKVADRLAAVPTLEREQP